MKIFAIIILALMATSSAFAGSFLCQSRSQTIVLKQSGESSLFLIYECDKSVTSCTSAMVFEKLGFEEEGSFSLHGQRSNGQRAVYSLVKAKLGWTASMSSAQTRAVQDVLLCVPYLKK